MPSKHADQIHCLQPEHARACLRPGHLPYPSLGGSVRSRPRACGPWSWVAPIPRPWRRSTPACSAARPISRTQAGASCTSRTRRSSWHSSESNRTRRRSGRRHRAAGACGPDRVRPSTGQPAGGVAGSNVLAGPVQEPGGAFIVHADPVPLENRIQLVIGKCSVPQAACVYSLIRP